MKAKILLVTSLFFLTQVLPAQSVFNDTLMIDGISRNYILYQPAIYDGSQAVPLVINMHGYGSNSTQQALYGNFNNLADIDNFLVVSPNGTNDLSGTRYWNAFVTGGAVDDVSFISQLIDSLSAKYNIDQSQVFATGMSNGGFMSYRLACELTDRIAKIASVTGTMNPGLTTTCSPTSSIPVMEIHGTADAVVPYNGIPGSMEPIDDVIAYWVSHNNCDPTPSSSVIPDIDPNDGCTAERFEYGNGDNGSNVVLYKITGGGHTWPDALIDIPGSNTNHDFNASKAIWEFFKGEPFVGIKDHPELDGVEIHFNNDILLFEVQEGMKGEVFVLNSLGQVVLHTKETKLATHSLNPGMYFVHFSTDQGSYSDSFIKYQ